MRTTMVTLPGIRCTSSSRYSPVITQSTKKPFCISGALKKSFNMLLNQTKKLFSCRVLRTTYKLSFPRKTHSDSLFSTQRGMFSILAWCLLLSPCFTEHGLNILKSQRKCHCLPQLLAIAGHLLKDGKSNSIL